MRRRAAAEMLRVVRPGGVILWYDVRHPNPRNRDLVPIGRREIRAVFPGCEIDFATATLLPPLARRLAPLSPVACRLLEALVPPLRSHLAALIRRPA